jgi:hypothetical protein
MSCNITCATVPTLTYNQVNDGFAPTRHGSRRPTSLFSPHPRCSTKKVTDLFLTQKWRRPKMEVHTGQGI